MQVLGGSGFPENVVLHDPTDQDLDNAFDRLVHELKLVADADSAPHMLVFRNGKLVQTIKL